MGLAPFCEDLEKSHDLVLTGRSDELISGSSRFWTGASGEALAGGCGLPFEATAFLSGSGRAGRVFVSLLFDKLRLRERNAGGGVLAALCCGADALLHGA